MAAEDLGRDRKRERRPAWAIDTGLPATDELTPGIVADMSPDTRRRLVAVALGEGAGTDDPRQAALRRQLSIYRDQLDGIDRRQRQAIGIEM